MSSYQTSVPFIASGSSACDWSVLTLQLMDCLALVKDEWSADHHILFSSLALADPHLASAAAAAFSPVKKALISAISIWNNSLYLIDLFSMVPRLVYVLPTCPI